MSEKVITYRYASETFPDVLGIANKNREGDCFNNVFLVTSSSPEEVNQGIETNIHTTSRESWKLTLVRIKFNLRGFRG